MSGQEGKGMLCQQWVYFNLRIFIIFFKDEITSMFKYRQGRSYREEEDKYSRERTMDNKVS